MTEVGKLTITYSISADGDMITGLEVDGDIPVVVQLGLLRLAEDTILTGTDQGGEDD